MPTNPVEDYKFASMIRVPRRLIEDDASPSARLVTRWAEKLSTMAGRFGKEVELFQPDRGQNKFLFAGNEPNTVTTASLFRKVVIEICDGSFDALEMADFSENAFAAQEKIRNAKPPQLPSCRVDFETAIDGFNQRQTKSFKRMEDLFGKIGVAVSRPENRPCSIQLTCADGATLKTARLTAEWAARTIGDHEITQNKLNQTFATQSVQALGQKRGALVAQLAYA